MVRAGKFGIRISSTTFQIRSIQGLVVISKTQHIHTQNYKKEKWKNRQPDLAQPESLHSPVLVSDKTSLVFMFNVDYFYVLFVSEK